MLEEKKKLGEYRFLEVKKLLVINKEIECLRFNSMSVEKLLVGFGN